MNHPTTSYREADLRLCFRIYAKSRFSHDEAHITRLSIIQVYLFITPLTITYIIYIINGHVSWLQIRLFSYRSDVNNFIINTVSLITQCISMDPKDSVIMR